MAIPRDKNKRKRLWSSVDKAERNGMLSNASDLTPTAPWNYLRLDPTEQAAYDRLQDALEEKGSHCENIVPSPWMDYDMDGSLNDGFDAPYEKPSRVEAGQMCDGCPIFSECEMFANVSRPVHGVWAGKMWFNRRKY